MLSRRPRIENLRPLRCTTYSRPPALPQLRHHNSATEARHASHAAGNTPEHDQQGSGDLQPAEPGTQPQEREEQRQRDQRLVEQGLVLPRGVHVADGGQERAEAVQDPHDEELPMQPRSVALGGGDLVGAAHQRVQHHAPEDEIQDVDSLAREVRVPPSVGGVHDLDGDEIACP